jgi:hypothetical protein
MSGIEWGKQEYVTQLTAEELEAQTETTEATAFTNKAFTQLMDWFEWSDPIGEELWKRFAQINEQLNLDKNNTTLYASNESLILEDSMEINRTDIDLANTITLNRFKTQFSNQYPDQIAA